MTHANSRIARYYNVILCLLVIVSGNIVAPAVLHAGPPFVTDDPEPVEYRHWEFYIASQFNYSKGDISGTAPHVEVNYGVIPDVQIHLIAPVAYSITRGKEIDLHLVPPISYDSTKWNRTQIGYGYTEIGMKVRFLHESDRVPQLGIFPMIEAPTGSRNLGYNGLPLLYLPLYLQKSWDKVTTYGGGGFWYNPGKNNRNYWFAGWLLQYKITDLFTLGGEFFYYSPDTRDAVHRVSANLGMIVDFNENWHLLFSIGRDIKGPNILFSYLSVQFTI
jgi:hypothetical protein